MLETAGPTLGQAKSACSGVHGSLFTQPCDVLTASTQSALTYGGCCHRLLWRCWAKGGPPCEAAGGSSASAAGAAGTLPPRCRTTPHPPRPPTRTEETRQPTTSASASAPPCRAGAASGTATAPAAAVAHAPSWHRASAPPVHTTPPLTVSAAVALPRGRRQKRCVDRRDETGCTVGGGVREHLGAHVVTVVVQFQRVEAAALSSISEQSVGA